MALLVPNHHVIVPETQDLAIQTTSIQSQEKDRIYIELFGDSIICGRDPDVLDPLCGVCSNVDSVSARVAQPPGALIEFFLPQYKLVVITRSSGHSTSEQLLKGTDGVNERWPDNIDANIVVINHGMNDAKIGVPVQEYKNNLIALRQRLGDDKIMVWQTPTVNKYWNTNPYAEAMRQVAVQYGDFVADANRLPGWLTKLPDGMHPRQLGYAELVDVCLSSQLNSAIIKHLNAGSQYESHSYYRKDYQEKFILDYENEVQLSFTPFVHKWVEVYLRDNLSFTAISRGLRDIGGQLDAGVWSENTGEQITNTTESYNLVRIRREDGRVVFNKNYKTDKDVKEVKRLANDLNGTNNQYIVVLTTRGDPSANRLSPELLEAVYRCGASQEVFESPLFKIRSAYTLVGIPGCGQGNGLEAYGGLTDASDAATAGNATSITVGTFKPFLTYYPIGTTNEAWSELLNTYSVWKGSLSSEYEWQVFFANPGIYTISVSADNTANVYIAANTITTSSNVSANLSYSKILETVGTDSQRYGTPQADSFVIPQCGWYDIKILAEDFGDTIQTPLYYTAANTLGSWSSLLNTYGIYDGDMEYEWEFYAPTTGIYTVELSTDNYGNLKIRPITSLEFTTVIETTPANGVTNYTSTSTKSQAITKGWHVIRMGVTSVGDILTQSIINWNNWTTGPGGVVGYNQNGRTVENQRVLANNPWNTSAVVWEARPLAETNDDGGWNTDWFNIDNTKMYRFSVWVRRTSTTSGGTFYLGMYANGDGSRRMDNGQVELNAYWECSNTGLLAQNQWYLWVGHVYPANTTYTGRNPNTGYYTTNGRVGDVGGCNIGSGDLKWSQNSTQSLHRTYLYYCSDNTTRLQFYQPRVDMCDGTEPSIQQLLNNANNTAYNVGGLAAVVKNTNGNTVWTTRDMRNPTKMEARGLAGIITDSAGVALWNTRSPRNAKENYEAPGQRTINPFYSYSEIEFGVSSSGIPFPIDIFPPVAQVYVPESGTIESIRTTDYKFISNIPPVNGTRLLNPKYAIQTTNGVPGSTYHITKDNKIKFSKPVTGIVTVISDTVDKLSANASVAKVQNIHSLTNFVQRFNPARWAFGSNVTVVSEDSGNTATRPFDNAAGVNSLGLYNSQIRIRVGDSRYAEPVILDQPQHGYARITEDRRHMAYVPFPDYSGLDAFTYTLLSQTGQAGQPKSVYVEVAGNVSVYAPYVPPTANTSAVPTVSISSFVVSEQSLYSVWVVTVNASANTSANFSLSLSGTATATSDYTPALSISNDGANVWTTINSVTPITMPSGTILARVPLIKSTVVELGETIILTADVEGGDFHKGVATISNASGAIFNNDWRYPASINLPPSIAVTSNIVREQSIYAIWVISGYATGGTGGFDPNAEGKTVTLSLSGTATRGTDYGIFLQVSQDNGATWAFYQSTNLPQIVNGFLLARVALIPDNRIEVGETIILSAGVSGANIARGTIVIDDVTGVEFTSTWSYTP